ncbi:MAG TPA: transporter [Burkholderiales bacterium]|nr:transporter [Burkholderiales bacterium]
MRSPYLTACAGALFALSAHAQDGALTLGGAFDYSSGDYGTTTTTRIAALSAIGRYETGKWIFKATVPYLSVDGDTGVIPGIGRARGAPARSTKESGMGDIVLSATYGLFYDKASTLGVDLTGKVKLGTADESKGLGTGEHDFAALIDLYKTYDRVTGFGGIGYHVMGDSPTLQLENAWSANLGASYRLDERDSVGAMLEGRQRVAAGGARQRDLMGFWTRRLDGGWKAQAYGLIGLADGSPDWGAGASLARAF